MASKRISAEEQYRLVIECRQSGKTDYQWCQENGINPGTFYNWVSRLRKKACYDIPESEARIMTKKASNIQDVVKVDILPDFTSGQTNVPMSNTSEAFTPVAEINVNGICIRLSNDAGSALINNIARLIGGAI